MPQHDARAELAPRDIVARAIDFEMKNVVWTVFFWIYPTNRLIS